MKKITLVVAIIASTLTLNAQNMGYVNTQKLLDTMQSRKTAMTTLQETEALFGKEVQESQASLQAEYQKYLAIKDLPTTSQTVKQYTEERLQKKEQELQARQQELSNMLQQQSAELNKPITDRVQKAIKIVAERKKLDFVIEETQSLYVNATKDITKDAMQELLKLEAEILKTTMK
jgi:outer membrane protein